MTFRSIFVHADGSEPCARRMAVAAHLATKYPSELRGGYLVPSVRLTGFDSAVLRGDAPARWTQQRADERVAVEAKFREAATGVASREFIAPEGDPLDAAVLNARYSDLVVLGQPPRDEPICEFANDIAGAVVTASGRPVLFVPYAGDFRSLGKRVMIAWKDSRESSRAVDDALPLLKDAEKVFAVAITPEDTDTSPRDRFTDAQLAAFLRRHDVAASVTRIAAPDIDAGELLLSHAADIGADLIVMGGYTRGRLTERLWGGVTKLMLQSMTVPVLMSH
jgi:nucleotide-binding universal stress UspA family protein